MKRKEKQIFKSGEKNPDGFSELIYYPKKQKIIVLFIVITIFIGLIISALHFSGVLKWNELLSSMGFIDGVESVDSDFVIYYLDVAQSDCSVVVCDGDVMLIDSGTKFQAHKIYESLFSMDIDHVDYLIITHQHDDHMAGASEILDFIDVDNILMPKLSDINDVNSMTYQDLINKIASENINPIAVSAGYEFSLGSSDIQILSPSEQDDNLNNMSVVLRISYGNTAFLFQGDAEKEVERQLMMSGYNLRANVLKLGHHGSNTSSSESYLDTVNPDYAIISSGFDNKYGHPNTYVMERLAEKGITSYMTGIHGNIATTSDGDTVRIITFNK